MGKLLASEFISLDGVFESPSWTMDFGFDPAMGDDLNAMMGPTTSDILLGRVTHAEFAPAWSTRSADDDPGAPFMNETTKHVVTSQALSTEWAGSRRVAGYSPTAITELKTTADGNVWTTGSGMLVRALVADRLIDELHLFVFPVVRGSGRRLFTDDQPTSAFALDSVRSYENGVLHAAYAPRS